MREAEVATTTTTAAASTQPLHNVEREEVLSQRTTAAQVPAGRGGFSGRPPLDDEGGSFAEQRLLSHSAATFNILAVGDGNASFSYALAKLLRLWSSDSDDEPKRLTRHARQAQSSHPDFDVPPTTSGGGDDDEQTLDADPAEEQDLHPAVRRFWGISAAKSAAAATTGAPSSSSSDSNEVSSTTQPSAAVGAGRTEVGVRRTASSPRRFSRALREAVAAGRCSLVCSVYDDEETLLRKYPESLHILRRMKSISHVELLFGLPLWEMRRVCETRRMRFDVVYWNHPHLGVEDYRLHKFLMSHFFYSASSALKRGGRICVSLVGGQAERWELLGQAERQGLSQLAVSPFDAGNWPGYEAKRNKSGKSFKNSHTQRHTGQSMSSVTYVFGRSIDHHQSTLPTHRMPGSRVDSSSPPPSPKSPSESTTTCVANLCRKGKRIAAVPGDAAACAEIEEFEAKVVADAAEQQPSGLSLFLLFNPSASSSSSAFEEKKSDSNAVSGDNAEGRQVASASSDAAAASGSCAASASTAGGVNSSVPPLHSTDVCAASDGESSARLATRKNGGGRSDGRGVADGVVHCYRCTHCLPHRNFATSQGLFTHNRQVHELRKYSKATGATELLKCSFCERKFADAEARTQHEVSQHRHCTESVESTGMMSLLLRHPGPVLLDASGAKVKPPIATSCRRLYRGGSRGEAAAVAVVGRGAAARVAEQQQPPGLAAQSVDVLDARKLDDDDDDLLFPTNLSALEVGSRDAEAAEGRGGGAVVAGVANPSPASLLFCREDDEEEHAEDHCRSEGRNGKTDGGHDAAPGGAAASSKFYPCEICGQAVPNGWSQQEHLELFRPMIGLQFVCPECGRDNFGECRALLQHLSFCRLTTAAAREISATAVA